jgi:hypothetical protein
MSTSDPGTTNFGITSYPNLEAAIHARACGRPNEPALVEAIIVDKLGIVPPSYDIRDKKELRMKWGDVRFLATLVGRRGV